MTRGGEAAEVDVRARIRDYIVDSLLDEDAPPEVTFETPLLSSGLIDSIGVEELLRYLEDEYAIEFDDDELSAENFESVDRIGRLVASKRSS